MKLPDSVKDFGKLSKKLEQEINQKLQRAKMILEKTFSFTVLNDQAVEVSTGELLCKVSRIERKDQHGHYDHISLVTLFLDGRELCGQEEEFWLKAINAKKIQEIAEEAEHSES